MFLDRSWVRNRLALMETYADGLKELRKRGKAAFDADPLHRLAAERGLHMAVECVVDVCNHLIDSYAMRDPSSYADILQIMIEEGVFEREWGERFLPVVDLRRRLVRDYDQLRADEIWQAVEEYSGEFDRAAEQFSKFLRLDASFRTDT
ncbi:MAG: DUF86 domain-containing protein [Alicyclobacillaceae bacterium]|nr:DUF86 domain-containing protein [Alicyclobacillaceae bacterium]